MESQQCDKVPGRPRLRFHLAVVLVVKVLLLFLLWHAFIKPNKVAVDVNVMRDRLRRPMRRDLLLRAAELYAERFALPDGRLRATFEVVVLTGWAPAEGQPKPLRPGSAAARLADALGAEEWSAGERAGR